VNFEPRLLSPVVLPLPPKQRGRKRASTVSAWSFIDPRFDVGPPPGINRSGGNIHPCPLKGCVRSRQMNRMPLRTSRRLRAQGRPATVLRRGALGIKESRSRHWASVRSHRQGYIARGVSLESAQLNRASRCPARVGQLRSVAPQVRVGDKPSRGFVTRYGLVRVARHELQRLWCPFGEVQQDLLLSSLTIG
jgi:hypothetical protein